MTVFILMVVIFVLGYTVIALEHPLKINKSATALFIGMFLWLLMAAYNQQIVEINASPLFNELKEMSEDIVKYIKPNVDQEHYKKLWEEKAILTQDSPEHNHYMEFVKYALGEHLNDIAQILFFLLGAMTIVETVDRYQGFRIITDRIKTKNPVKLIWLLSFLTFFMSAALDNLTTTIVMIALLRKLVPDQKLRWFFASLIVIAANAGGAWSPIGDVTTIMLWINGNITTVEIILGVFIPSLMSMIIPLIFVSMMLRKTTIGEQKLDGSQLQPVQTSPREQVLLLVLGVGGLLFVPVLKTLTHLPPYVGMLFSLSIVWITTEILVRRKIKYDPNRSQLSIERILSHVDVPTIFFFLGILMAVAALETAGHLDLLAKWLDKVTHTNLYIIDAAIGLLSSIVDNVPLTAAAMGMYPIADPATAVGVMKHFVQDGLFWELLAYTAGTGGSILIIGSAAGVAAMGLEKIDFIWYAKKITWLAALGYFAGIITYWLQESVFHILH